MEKGDLVAGGLLFERPKVVTELTNRQRDRVFAYRRYVDELAAGLERTA